MKIYGTVIMDIVNSRNIKGREEFQNKLNNRLNDISKKYADILLCPISIVLGDEWELITDKPSECYNLIHEIQQGLWPDDIYCYAGIGIGKISTGIYEDIRMMDGECFLLARQAVDIAKGTGRQKKRYIYSKHNKVYFKSSESQSNNDMITYDNPIQNIYEIQQYETAATSETFNFHENADYQNFTLENLINTLIENTEILISKMTKRQKEVYVDYIKYGSYRKMKDLCKERRYGSIGAISQSLNGSEYFTVKRNHEIIKSLLNIYAVSEMRK